MDAAGITGTGSETVGIIGGLGPFWGVMCDEVGASGMTGGEMILGTPGMGITGEITLNDIGAINGGGCCSRIPGGLARLGAIGIGGVIGGVLARTGGSASSSSVSPLIKLWT